MSGDRAGEPALVIQGPGWGPPADYLRETLSPLLADRRLLVHEVRNTGRDRSRPPRSHRADDLVDDLAAIVRRAGLGRHAIVAHSHGARIAAGYALRAPAGLERMVWITPGLAGREPPPEAAPILARLERTPAGAAAAGAIREGPGPDPDDRALARWSRRALPALFADPESCDRFLRTVRGAAPPSADACRGVSGDPGVGPDRLAEIDVPLLLISGRHDPLAHAGVCRPTGSPAAMRPPRDLRAIGSPSLVRGAEALRASRGRVPLGRAVRRAETPPPGRRSMARPGPSTLYSDPGLGIRETR